MKARMEKYNTNTTTKTRTNRNERLYDEVQDMNIDYVNIDVSNAIELNPNKNAKSSREDFQKQRELNKILPKNEERTKYINQEVEAKEDRIYDINEILKLARQNKLFEDTEKKRLINTEYNILTKLDIHNLETEDMKKEDLRSLIDDIYAKEKPVKEKKYARKEEDRLLNDLFDDYDEKTEPVEEIKLKEELSQEILDKTNEQIVDNYKDDYEEDKEEPKISELEEIKEEKEIKKESHHEIEDTEMSEDYIEIKEGKGLLIAIIIVTILILLTGAFFVYEYFFGL